MKHHLKKRINDLIKGEEQGEELTILYVNPVTGETEVLYQSPAAKNLDIEVDTRATGETYLKLTHHGQSEIKDKDQ